MEFKPFKKIPSLRNIEMSISQKIHGSNAQIVIVEYPENPENAEQWMFSVNEQPTVVDDKSYFIRAGSRNRWISPADDNYGFATFVEKNKEELVRKLGVGQHFGEWAGSGINSGEGLKDKVFVLFDYWKYPPERPLPPQCVAVPVLYRGPFDLGQIEKTMNDLKTNGSRLCPGFMKPEGIVINVLGHLVKNVFDAEETQWKNNSKKTKSTEAKGPNDALIKYGHLFQPIRMEKLLSRDEKYIREFPSSLSQICADYMSDLITEGQLVGDESEVKSARKAINGELFKFVKECVAKQREINENQN